MKKNKELKDRKISIKYLNYIVILLIIFFNVGYSAFNSKMNITGIVANVRVEENIRITKLRAEEIIENSTTTYTDYNKDRLLLGIKLPTKTSKIKYKVEITNIGNIEMGIFGISGLPEELEYELEGYNLQDKLCDINGACSLGIKKEFYITVKYKETAQVEDKIYNLNLKLDFREMHKVTYEGITNNNYKTEVIDGGNLEVTFTNNIPKKVVPYINGNKVTNYNYTNNTIIVENVTGDINLKYKAKVYLASLPRDTYFKTNDYLTKIKSINFIDNQDIPSDPLITYNLEENNGTEIKGWIDKDYNLYIGSEWDIYSKDLSNAFYGMSGVTSVVFNNLNTSETTTMYYTFANMSNLTSLDLSSFNTSKVTNMRRMFSDSSNLVSLNINNFDTSKVTNIASMFSNCSSLTNLDLRNFDTKEVTDTAYLFNNCSNLTSIDVSHFDTSKVTSMTGMFYGCSNLNSLDLSRWNTSKVNNMISMFEGCSSLTTLDITNFNTSNIETNDEKGTGLSWMFSDCSSLTTLDVSSFDVSRITNINGMFFGMNSLTSLDLSKWDTSKITHINNTFNGCKSLTSLDLRSFTLKNIIDGETAFSRIPTVANIVVKTSDDRDWLRETVGNTSWGNIITVDELNNT